MKILIYVKSNKKGIILSGPTKSFPEVCNAIMSLGFYNTETSEDGKHKLVVYYPPSSIEKISEVVSEANEVKE